MDATEVLRTSESSALNDEQIVSNVVGKNKKTNVAGKLGGITVVGFITALVAVFAVLFSSGNFIPAAISERLIEETDVQYADAVESKKLVFQQALMSGEVPDNTAKVLAQNGVLVGYMENGEFKEGNQYDGELVLKMDDKVIKAKDFVSEVSSNLNLYNAFNNATYSRAAYYYDEAARKVFQKIGTSRNNYAAESDFEEVMAEKMGSGSDINVNSISLVEGEDGNHYEESGGAANSNTAAMKFIEEVRNKNPAATAEDSALNAADSLKVADTIAKEQRSSLFFSLFMENISKMKAGEGNESKINEAMNFLYDDVEAEVVDVKTGEMIKTKGTALDATSLYAILSGEKVNPEKVENYSSDRILKTVENKLINHNGDTAIKSTIASTETGVRGSIGRLIKSGVERASEAILELVSPTVSSSLVENSYDTIKGVNAGEFLVEGAVNTGKMLAKASGATAGDATSVTEYARLNSAVLAMDAEVDRMNRSPFDMTSKNTFLGSILYDFAISTRLSGGSIMARVSSVMGSMAEAVATLMPGAYADEADGYLTTFGGCETYGTIGAVGSAQCSEIAIFDTSTLDNTFNDAGFKAFVEENTVVSAGTRTIKEGSVLANFIIYNDERTTPLGVTDGGILDSLSSGSGSVSFLSNILEMIEKFLGTSESDKRIATGAAFVNSSTNADWQTYKYAQRYVSLARATEALRQYSDGSTAYNNIRYFEGGENPVVAFLGHYYSLASR